MPAFKCSLCERNLAKHCGQPCNWWRCANKACKAATYDVKRGVLVYEDGTREQLGTG